MITQLFLDNMWRLYWIRGQTFINGLLHVHLSNLFLCNCGCIRRWRRIRWITWFLIVVKNFGSKIQWLWIAWIISFIEITFRTLAKIQSFYQTLIFLERRAKLSVNFVAIAATRSPWRASVWFLFWMLTCLWKLFSILDDLLLQFIKFLLFIRVNFIPKKDHN